MIDPITLEVLRCKFEAIAEDGARTIIRNAISPVIAESKDCACAVYNAKGELIVGGGKVQIAFHIGGNTIEATLRAHGDSIAEGDVFLTNDPFNGGGLHAQDVVVLIPLFDSGRIIAWIGTTGHMMDMGGMVPGSFSTAATEVYQEAFRLPPVRIFRDGVEQSDVFAILRTNVRIADVVEMDLRSLISGATVVTGQLQKIIDDYGVETFLGATERLAELTEIEVRKRIAEIEPGEYSATSWTEWNDEVYEVPCTLRVEGGSIEFDFRGASPQCNHYFNSRAEVIKSLVGVGVAPYLALGLPFNEGLFRAFKITCEPGSILDARAPAPVGGAHLLVGQNALEVAVRALNLALAASPNARASRLLAGPSASSGTALHTLSGLGLRGEPQGWLMLEGGNVGAAAGHDRDAIECARELVGKGQVSEIADVEVLESWYPIEFERRGVVAGPIGSGKFCGGRPNSIAYKVSGTKELGITIMGNRERVPGAGMAGGLPGGLTRYSIRRGDTGEWERVWSNQDGVKLFEGDTLALDVSSGGGWGDPLERDPGSVEAELREGLLTVEQAHDTFGVILGHAEATTTLRDQLRRKRLDTAVAARQPLIWTDELRRLSQGVRAPLFPGVEQHGKVAISTASGEPLAVSPNSWFDGCPRIHHFQSTPSQVDVVAYLEPATGALLAVDVVYAGTERSFAINPTRWVDARGPSLQATVGNS
jgi:N-methylhydantoinase B